jgi:hypothetical protein
LAAKPSDELPDYRAENDERQHAQLDQSVEVKSRKRR